MTPRSGSRALSARKDRWHPNYFQYGSLVLPRGHSDREVIAVSGQAVERFDGRVLVGRVADAARGRAMTGTQEEIVWSRWAIYLLAGPPILFWLFFVRDNVLRLAAVLFVLVFIQDSFVQRRFVWAISFGPSTIVVYVALLSLIVQRGRLPSFSRHTAARGSRLLFFSMRRARSRARSDGYPFENFFALQRFFIEAIPVLPARLPRAPQRRTR